VLHVEDLGAEVIAHVEVDAIPVATEDVRELVADTDAVSLRSSQSESARGARVLIARLPAEADVRVGESTRVGFELRKVHLFDLESGLALDWRSDHVGPEAERLTPEREHGTRVR